ncbi:MAG TPA: MOSC domain-containing protein [Myxococcota bacterium]|nr:MOSC domain-containing protein [Myxococcota bacterium]
MKLVSVNVGLPREVDANGHRVRTSIWKAPVAGRVRVRTLNLDGDRQSDLSVHGGVDKAVYAYPSEHYAFWQRELGRAELPWGAFGENLTTEGLLDDEVAIGDRVRAGTAELEVTQPRMPCFKLALRFERPDLVKRFQKSGRTGFYFRVLQEGEVGAGDALELMRAPGDRVSIADAMRVAIDRRADPEQVRRISVLPGLSAVWREEFLERLAHG